MNAIAFASPWVLAAAAALAVPVLAHLARHEDRAGRGFPSLMFLSRVPFPARARHRIEDRVLLALRALALLALVLAFAGPTLVDPQGAAQADSRDTVVLLDRSYSMGLGDRFERARAAAGAAITAAGTRGRVALLGFDTSPVTMSGLADGPDAARAALAGAQPGPRGTDIARALDGAWQLLADSTAAQRRVVLVSDLQAVGLGAEPRLAQDVELEVHAIDGALPANLALLAAWRERDAGTAAGPTLLRARVANTGGEPGAATLRVTVDDLAASEQALRLAPGEWRDVTLPVFAAADRATRVLLSLDPDALAADDRRYLVLGPQRALEVLVVREPAQAAGYLGAVLALARDPAVRARTVAPDALTPAMLASADAIVLDGVVLDGGEPAMALARRVAAGAGLLAFASAGPDPRAPAVPRAITAATSPPEAVFGVPGVAVDAGVRGTTFGPLAADHPLARALGPTRLAGLRVWRYRRGDATPGDVVLAHHADGGPALVERRHARGTTLLVTTALARTWSELAVDPVFVPLVLEALAHVTGRERAPLDQPPGSVLDPARHVAAVSGDGPLARAVAAGEPLWLRAPAGTAHRVRAGDPLRLDQPGFHELRSDGGAALPVAVSVAAAESSLQALTGDAFMAQVRRFAPPATTVRAAADPQRDGELARGLLVLGLCLLLAEGALAAIMLRRRAPREALA